MQIQRDCTVVILHPFRTDMQPILVTQHPWMGHKDGAMKTPSRETEWDVIGIILLASSESSSFCFSGGISVYFCGVIPVCLSSYVVEDKACLIAEGAPAWRDVPQSSAVELLPP